MNEKEFEEMMNETKNRLEQMGQEVTSTSSASLALELGKLAFSNDNFKNASLEEIMYGTINFVTSYFNSRPDFQSLTHKQRTSIIAKYVVLLQNVFTVTEYLTTKAIENGLMKRVNNSCDHKGFLIEYVLNEEYWYCTKCDTKIKKRVDGKNYDK